MDLEKASHSVYKIRYHIVLCVKYRKSLFEAEIRQAITEIFEEISERFDIYYHEVGFEEEHVHVMCGASPKYAPSYIVMITKSKTAPQMFKRFPELKKELWGGHFWSAGKYIGTVGDGLNEEIIKKYIRNQEQDKNKAESRIKQLTLFPFLDKKNR